MKSQYQPISESIHVNKLFVGGLPNTATESEIRELFSRFGEILSVILPIYKSKFNKGFAFVEFSDSAAINDVFKNLSSLILRAKLVS